MRHFVFLLLFVSVSATPASYYVDPAATGSNDGSSWANAWTSPASISNNPDPGDTVYFSGGSTSQTYTNAAWSIGSDGTAGSPITYTVGDSAGHNGTVLFDYSFMGVGCPTTNINNGMTASRNYTILDGKGKWVWANLVHISNRLDGICILGNGKSGVQIRGMVFSNVNVGVRFYNMQDCVLENNAFLGIRGDVAAMFTSSKTNMGSTIVRSNYVQMLFNDSKPTGDSRSFAGPDGFQISNGTDCYSNIFQVSWTTLYTSTQHPDSIQLSGSWTRIFDNRFINVGDSAVDIDLYYEPFKYDVWIYNNIFACTEQVDWYPEYIRLYGSGGAAMTNIANLRIMNNLFVDLYDDLTSVFGCRVTLTASQHPFGSGILLANNCFYDVGRGSGKGTLRIMSSTNWNSSAFTFSNNVYYHTSPAYSLVEFLGTEYTGSNWVKGAYEINGQTNKPTFAAYTKYSSSNDYTPTSVLNDAGTDLSAYFTADMLGSTRSVWDVGPIEASSSGNTINVGTLTVDKIQ